MPRLRRSIDCKADAFATAGVPAVLPRVGPLLGLFFTDDAPTGKVELGEKVERGDIPRADVADLVRRCLQDPSTIGKQFEAVGGETGIPDALAAL